MSLLKPGFGVAALSGKLGGNVYARNRGGLYVRSIGTTVQPETPDQVDKMDIWINMAAAYNDLTAGQIDAWRDYANQLTKTNRIGEVKKPQARNIFCECYTNCTMVDVSAPVEPTEFTNRPAITTLGECVVASDGTNVKTYTLRHVHGLVPSGGEGWLLFSPSPITKPSIRNVNNQYRMVVHRSLSEVNYDLLDPYTAKFGSAALPGWIAHTKVRLIDEISGLGSTPLVSDQTLS